MRELNLELNLKAKTSVKINSMTKKHTRFIIIDDDPINNLLCSKNIRKTVQDADIITFIEAEKALQYIKSNFNEPNAGNAILFLDINMPTMTGWEFLEQFEKINATIKNHISIYMLSSSISQDDKQKAKIHPDVIEYIEKPLSIEVLKMLI